MSIILLQCYGSSAERVFDTFCDGTLLCDVPLGEYVSRWYEVKLGNKIRIRRHDDDIELDVTFEVVTELPDPPQKPNDPHAGMHVLSYLSKHCKKLT